MTWYYNNIPIAEITGDPNKTYTDVHFPERFRDRLELDHQTGSLTIMNTRTTDSGLYNLQIIRSSSRRLRRSISSVKSFDVIVIGSGLSSVVLAGICVAVLLMLAAAASVMYFYHKRKGKYHLQTL
ncbi:hypothetical protein R3I94_017841 [Phoxinus phoxinus]